MSLLFAVHGCAISVVDAVDSSSTRRASTMDVGAVKAPTIRRRATCTNGLRQSVWISQKSTVFQVHGVDTEGNVVIRQPRWLKHRRYVMTFFQKLPPCLVGIEACASSHHWSRELQAIHCILYV